MWRETGSADRHDKPALYAELAQQLRALLDGEQDRVANAANASALLFNRLPQLNWAGFYFLDASGQELVLGPFQGKPACVRIRLDRGVCGQAARSRRSVVVQDVHAFPGHIACDEASRSELVVPLLSGSQLLGVLDLDSPQAGRFDEMDRVGCERLAGIYVESLTGMAGR